MNDIDRLPDILVGPLLRRISTTRLGLVDEWMEGATVDDSQALYYSPDS